jgi:hypothetical protein
MAGVKPAWGLLVLLLGCDRPPPGERPAIGLDASDGRITVEVLNGSNRDGVARLGTLALREAGLDVLTYGTAETVVDTTLVLVRRGAADRGRLVARALGRGVVRVETDTLRRVDVTVILGRDWTPRKGRP